MKDLSIKAKIYLLMQIIFVILTFTGAILLFIGKMDNAGMAVVCSVMSLAFEELYAKEKNEK